MEQINRNPWTNIHYSTKPAFAKPARRDNPYVLIFSDRTNFTWNLLPLFEYLQAKENIDTSMVCLKEGNTLGLVGSYNKIPYCKNLYRKPDIICTNHAWWDEGYKVCSWAKRFHIPVVAIEHGCTLFHQARAKYRRNIGLATKKCLWSQANLDMMLRYNPANKRDCIITGTPRYDNLFNYKPEKRLDLPKDFALVLSTWSVQKDEPRLHANKLLDHIPVVMKVHPNETHYPGREPNRIVKDKVQLVYEQESLIELLYRCRFVVTTISSAMLPALYFEKPIFIVNKPQAGMDFSSFEQQGKNIFNFKKDYDWNNSVITSCITPNKKDFTYYGYTVDGQNCERILNVLKDLL
jgi:hypothetical protein